MYADEPQAPAGSLTQLARVKFRRTFNDAELKVLSAASKGDVAYCGPSKQDDHPDPSKADNEEGGWGKERQISAELIRWLCVDRRAKDQVDPRGIQILGAKVTGELNLSYVTVPFPLRFLYCSLSHASLDSVEIPNLDFKGSWVRSLNAEYVKVKEDVSLSDGFHAEGAVVLGHAQIGGNLSCEGGWFINPPSADLPEAWALDADTVRVAGNVFLRNFHAEGGVRLIASQIGGTLDCTKGTFIKPAEVGSVQWSVLAERATVKGGVWLTNGFSAEGTVGLADARISGLLDFRKGIFKARLDLRDTSADSIMDSGEESWPNRGSLFLDGFVYERISESPRDPETRLKWLDRQSDFTPQPYLQLSKFLREAGNDDGAKRVLVEMENRRGNQDVIDHVWRPLFRITVGYGYRPLLAFWEVAGLSALGWILYRRGYLAGTMVPTDKDAHESLTDGKPPKHYSAFAPLIYSLENSLPLVKLGQGDKWQPAPNSESAITRPKSSPNLLNLQGQQAGRAATGAKDNRGAKAASWPKPGSGSRPNTSAPLRSLHRFLVSWGFAADRLSRWTTSPSFLRWFLWIQILLGWLLATLFVAGVTGVVRKE